MILIAESCCCLIDDNVEDNEAMQWWLVNVGFVMYMIRLDDSADDENDDAVDYG